MVEPSVGLHAVEITPIRLMDTAASSAWAIRRMTLLGAQLRGAGQIIVTDMSEHRLRWPAVWARTCASTWRRPTVAAIRGTGGPRRRLFEAVGYAPTVQQAHAVTRTGGNVT